MDKNMKRQILQIVAFAILLYCAVTHIDIVWYVFRNFLSLLAPFILGGSIAFIINVPMKNIEKHLFKKNVKMQKFKRPLSYVLTLLLILGILALALVVIIPELVNTTKMLAQQIPIAFNAVQNWIQKNSEYWPMIATYIESAEIDFSSLSSKAVTLLQSGASKFFSSSVDVIGSVISGIVSFVIGIVFSVYLLFQKEKLSCQAKKILYALLPVKTADRVVSVTSLANHTFSNFLSGQCLEACILGTLFVIVMSILRMPYAVMIGVVIALTALIPVVGGFIGCAVGMFLIVMVNPMQALWFLVLFLILQQLEGNLIYPRVVGNSVGLPSIWVLAAVSIGSSLFGILGILVFIPLCSVCYALFRDFVHVRLKKRNIAKSKYK